LINRNETSRQYDSPANAGVLLRDRIRGTATVDIGRMTLPLQFWIKGP
jgi:hypothetical protein